MAPNEAAAAQYYPAIYWYSMLKIPRQERVRRQGSNSREDNADRMAQLDEEQRLHRLPSDRAAFDAHVPEERPASDQYRPTSRRSVVPPHPVRPIRRTDVQPTSQRTRRRAGRYFADWTDRIAKGELPHAKPARPQGVERNIVVTTWDWLNEKHYLHDLIASDRRYPTVNAYGPLYGSTEYSTDIIPVLDPKTHRT